MSTLSQPHQRGVALDGDKIYPEIALALHRMNMKEVLNDLWTQYWTRTNPKGQIQDFNNQTLASSPVVPNNHLEAILKHHLWYRIKARRQHHPARAPLVIPPIKLLWIPDSHGNPDRTRWTGVICHTISSFISTTFTKTSLICTTLSSMIQRISCVQSFWILHYRMNLCFTQ